MTNSLAVGVWTPLPLVDGASNSSAAMAYSPCWLRSSPSISSSAETRKGMIRSVTLKRIAEPMNVKAETMSRARRGIQTPINLWVEAIGQGIRALGRETIRDRASCE